MAYPTLVSVGAFGAATGTPFDVPYPAGIQENDIIILHMVGSGSSPTPPVQTGFTDGSLGIGGTSASAAQHWRRSDGTETGNLSVAWTTGSNVRGAFMSAWRGCVESGTPWEDGSAVTVDAVDITSDDIVTTDVERTVLVFFGKDIDEGPAEGPASPPSGWTEVAATGTGVSTDLAAYLISKEQATADTVPGPTVSFTSGAAAFAISVALIPAVTGGGSDTTPDAFSFTDQTGIALSTQVESNTITVAGIDAAAAISITGGGAEYRINAGAYTTVAGTVNNGDTVQLRMTSSGSYITAVNTTLDIGGVTDQWTVTTTGNVPLAGQASMTFSNSGNATLLASLTGQSAMAFTPAGALAMAMALVGQSAVAFTPAADLTLITQSLSGTVSMAFSNAGALSLTANLNGTAAPAFSNSGSLSLNAKIAGDAGFAFTNGGDLTTFTVVQLAGDAGFAFINGGDLSIWPYVTLTSVHSPSSERLTSVPDLEVGDQIEYGVVQGTGAVVVNADGTFVADSGVGAFSFRVWSATDRTFGAVAVQDLTGATYVELAGQSALAFTPSANLGYKISLAGVSAMAFASAGSLGYKIALAGDAGFAFAPAAVLTMGQALAGQVDVAFAPTANLEILSGSDLAGGITMRFANSGTLDTVGVQELAGECTITFTPSANLFGALDVTPGDMVFAPFETTPTSAEARMIASFGVPAGYSATIGITITPEPHMTIRVGESGKAFRYFTAYDMSAYTALTLKFVRPDGTSFSRTNPAVYLGGGVVDPQLGSLPAQQYLEYLIQPNDFTDVGEHTVTGQFENLVPDPDTILIGPTVTFTVEAGMPA